MEGKDFSKGEMNELDRALSKLKHQHARHKNSKPMDDMDIKILLAQKKL